MDLRLALHELAARHRLDAASARRLGQIAGLDRPPEALVRWLPRGVAALAALLALLGIGGLFAYFGQTYQTGADAWQLFALWAALAVPLGLALRSDLLWSAWVLVAMTAISLWLFAHVSPGFETPSRDLPIWLAGWSCAVLLAALLSPPIGARLGAGKLARRVAVAFATVLLAGGALFGLFQSPVAWQYPLGLLLLAAAAALLYRARSFDLANLSCVALGLDGLLLAGLSRGLYLMDQRNVIGQMLLITVASALLLSLTVKLVLQRARAVQQDAEPHHV